MQIYKVRHGDWCPLPEGFNESQCTFVPVGYIQNERYYRTNNGFYKDVAARRTDGSNVLSPSEYQQQKARYIGSCDIYIAKNDDIKLNVGLKGKRRAVAESKSARTWSGGGDNGNDYSVDNFSYGELYVLVIAKQ